VVSAPPGAPTPASELYPSSISGPRSRRRGNLPGLASGEIVGAYALSESSSGSDALNWRTRATLSVNGRHYLLNGEKMWITNAGFADLFIVFAKVHGEKFTEEIMGRSPTW
jgi:alkylation response protein AidB-like acyl-CoA dehydrogenase